MPAPKAHGRPRFHNLREILNAVFYIPKSSCQWRLLPHDVWLEAGYRGEKMGQGLGGEEARMERGTRVAPARARHEELACGMGQGMGQTGRSFAS
jgi:hypothetical protein